MNENWWGWIAVVLFFLIAQAWRALFRIAKAPPNNGMARLSAAAERILKERGVSGSNPLPRTKSKTTMPVQAKAPPAKSPVSKALRVQSSGVKARATTPMSTSIAPAVVRRGGLLSSGKEPVIQRRH